MARSLALIRGACVCLAGARKRGLHPFPAWQRGQSPFRKRREKGTAPFAAPPAKQVPGALPRAVTSQPFRLDE